MKRQDIRIGHIPAVLWGEVSERMFIAVHGDQSDKTDEVIAVLAEEAAKKGYQTLSFDLPEHGERKGEQELCKPQNCVAELKEILAYIKDRGIKTPVSLFGCSIGAWFSMLAFEEEELSQALFLSPVVDMERIISNMMTWFSVTETQLMQEQEVRTPVKTLYWDYYQYVREHPVSWNHRTALLYGEADNLCEYEYVKGFADRCHAKMTVLKAGEHFFHTREQLTFLRQWLQERIMDIQE